jgi:glycosyltransferase involved in cell wall biosynthesis
MRVLIAAHGHPAITHGGAETAAYALFTALGQEPAFETWFLGCRPNPAAQRLGIAITQPFGDREFIYAPAAFDWFKFANRDAAFPDEFRRLLREIRPEIIHFHHFAFFGLEAFRIAKETLPNCRVIFTAHEYLLICNAYGQMVTKQDQHLCYQATPEACHACFPQYSQADFFLRRHYANLFLPALDAIIAPSRFMSHRLAHWGLDPSRIRVIENVTGPGPSVAASAPNTSPTRPLRVGFFGQISRLKGIVVLLQAANQLEQDGANRISIEIHGDYRGQPPEFQAEFLALLKQAGSNVHYHGPYRPEDVDMLMQQVAAIVVPSIWWENSPVVIQEAFRNKRPVICSGIGGMAEKVRNGVDGWHFAVSNSMNLAAVLAELAENRGLVAQMSASLQVAPDARAAINQHTSLYDTLRERRSLMPAAK